jgi:hypothetical protein
VSHPQWWGFSTLEEARTRYIRTTMIDTQPRSGGSVERAAELARDVSVGDGVAWLRGAELPASHAVVTSLPDTSEMRSHGFDAWRTWFVDTATLVCSRVAEDAVAVFYQTDVKRDGRWIDKAYLVAQGAERAGSACLFHRIVCRAPAGSRSSGRPGYAHLIAFSRGLRVTAADSGADVLPQMGEMSWARAMGTAACEDVCRYLLHSTGCRVVVDPFCGLGTMLAVANAYGLGAVGVEISAKRAAKARTLRFHRELGLR